MLLRPRADTSYVVVTWTDGWVMVTSRRSSIKQGAWFLFRCAHGAYAAPRHLSTHSYVEVPQSHLRSQRSGDKLIKDHVWTEIIGLVSVSVRR